jgi:cytochrome c oxidase subunit 3
MSAAEAQAHHDPHGHAHAHGAGEGDGTFLQHHFDDVGQQHESSMLGMWAFLATEVMFFGGLFAAYAIYRSRWPDAFGAASRMLNIPLGAVNTGILLVSSLTMAMAVRASQLGDRKAIVRNLLLTMLFGTAFLGVKAVEWTADYEEHLIPSIRWDWDHAKAEHAKKHGAEHQPAAEARAEVTEGSPERNDMRVEPLSESQRAEMFFVLYFFMTGLHAIHLIIGVVLVGIIAYLTHTRWLTGAGATQIEVTGLYWHFIDIVWVFLYPLLYLIEVRPS